MYHAFANTYTIVQFVEFPLLEKTRRSSLITNVDYFCFTLCKKACNKLFALILNLL